jgi:hypothetical protein
MPDVNRDDGHARTLEFRSDYGSYNLKAPVLDGQIHTFSDQPSGVSECDVIHMPLYNLFGAAIQIFLYCACKLSTKRSSLSQ